MPLSYRWIVPYFSVFPATYAYHHHHTSSYIIHPHHITTIFSTTTSISVIITTSLPLPPDHHHHPPPDHHHCTVILGPVLLICKHTSTVDQSGKSLKQELGSPDSNPENHRPMFVTLGKSCNICLLTWSEKLGSDDLVDLQYFIIHDTYQEALEIHCYL